MNYYGKGRMRNLVSETDSLMIRVMSKQQRIAKLRFDCHMQLRPYREAQRVRKVEKVWKSELYLQLETRGK